MEVALVFRTLSLNLLAESWLSNDRGERNNLAKSKPKKLQQLVEAREATTEEFTELVKKDLSPEELQKAKSKPGRPDAMKKAQEDAKRLSQWASFTPAPIVEICSFCALFRLPRLFQWSYQVFGDSTDRFSEEKSPAIQQFIEIFKLHDFDLFEITQEMQWR